MQEYPDYADNEWALAGPPNDLSLFLVRSLPELILLQADYISALKRVDPSQKKEVDAVMHTLSLIQAAINLRSN